MNVQELEKMIRDNIEDEETPARVLAWARENDGKGLRRNNIPEGFFIRKQYGMTNLQQPCYMNTGGREGGSYLLAHSETGVTISVEYLLDHNPAYFAARQKRNAQRAEMLADPETLARVARLVTEAADTRAAFLAGIDSLNFPDFCQIEPLALGQKRR